MISPRKCSRSAWSHAGTAKQPAWQNWSSRRGKSRNAKRRGGPGSGGAPGDGKVTIHLAASAVRTPRRIVLEGRGVEDLTALRRSARARSQPPVLPAKAAAPVVENGTLIIIGGGGMPAGLFGKFVQLAGGPKASIIVFPTAMPDPLPARDPAAAALERLGAGKGTVLKGRTQAEVESKEFLEALRSATGIWL